MFYSNVLIFQKAETYLTSVKVDVQNITSGVYKIRDGNNGSGILVRGKSFSYSHNESTSCCNFEYFVLNAECKAIVSCYLLEVFM